MEKINYSNYSWIILSAICSVVYFSSTLQIKIKYSWLYKCLSIVFLGLFCFYNINIKQIELIYFSIILAALGDFFLAYNAAKYFLQGLAAFLCAHLLSAIFFMRHFDQLNLINYKILVLITLLLIFSTILYKFIAKNLKNYKYPVIIYIITLLIMSYSAILSHFYSTTLVFGILFFMTSDSILAVQKFKQNFKLADQFIWGSYYLAQLLIIFNLYMIYNGNF